MLMKDRFTQDYVNDCRKQFKGLLAAYRKLPGDKRAGNTTFEQRFLNQLLLAMDRHFVHRGRGMEGKDGNPLNEVRMLCDSIMEHGGRLTSNKTIRYKPEQSILKIAIGDKIQMSADDFGRLSAAFLDEIEKKFL